ncbi:MAG: hypothetical protein ACYS26_15345 [Planctomycetota bacterium]|jgi:hypothetical protein
MGKRLITEACVRRLAAGAELVIDADTIVTPAALDLAFARGHRVRRVAAGEATPAPRDGQRLAERLQTDGVYQVVVRDGRARVWRVTDGGLEEVE